MTKNLITPIALGTMPTSGSDGLFSETRYAQDKLLCKGPLKSFTDIDDIPFYASEFQSNIIKKLIKKQTNKKLIKYNKYKIFFVHPEHKWYSCDIFGNVFDISEFVKHKQVIYDDTIFLESFSEGYISYDYLKFKRECIPWLNPLVFYKNRIRNIEHNEKQMDEHYEIDKQKEKNLKEILIKMKEKEKLKQNYNESDDDSETYDSDNESDNESKPESDNESDDEFDNETKNE